MFEKPPLISNSNKQISPERSLMSDRIFQLSPVQCHLVKILGMTSLTWVLCGLTSQVSAQLPKPKILPASLESQAITTKATQPDAPQNTTPSNPATLGLQSTPAATEIAQDLPRDSIDVPPVIPDAIEPGLPAQPEPEIPETLPPPEELLEPSTPSEIPSNLDNISGNIRVTGFEVIGSTVFTPEEFDAVLEEFKGEISFAELLQARSAVTKLYTENGYVTSGALIPPQALEDGVVQIEVVEGDLEELLVTVDGKLNDDYVRSRLERATQAPLNVDRLLEALQLLQLNPLIDNLSAELSAGSRPGLNVLEVKVKEADTFSVEVFADNGRSPSVRSFRRGVTIAENDLLGFGDSLSVTYKNTDGSNEGEARYSIPVNASNGTLEGRFRITSSEIQEELFNLLDIQADSRDYELTFRQPLFQKPTEEFALGLTAARRESNTSLLGVDFPLSPGATEDGETRLSVLRFFQDYTKRGPRDVFAARSQFSLGLGAFGATLNGFHPDSRFFSWRGQLQYLRLLSQSENAPSLLLRSDAQLAATSLVPLEQFGVGGFESVRGYRQDQLLSDNGLFASAEVRFPLFRTNDRQGTLQLSPFFDVGTVWTTQGPNPDPTTLASLGLGLAWLQGDRFSARVDWGFPLIDVPERENESLQEQGIYFSVRWAPF
jgi:hemolysin activation/secretion protein